MNATQKQTPWIGRGSSLFLNAGSKKMSFGWRQKHSKRSRFESVLLILILLMTGALIFSEGLLLFPPHQYRRALLTCNLCGNSKGIHVWIRWYQLHRVRCSVSTVYPVPAGHVHRWWQWDGHHETWFTRHGFMKSLSTLNGWSRDRYENGTWEWDPDRRDQRAKEGHRPREAWIGEDPVSEQ